MRNSIFPVAPIIQWLRDRRSLGELSEALLSVCLCYTLLGVAYGGLHLSVFGGWLGSLNLTALWKLFGTLSLVLLCAIYLIHRFSDLPKIRWLEPLSYIRGISPGIVTLSVLIYFLSDELGRPFGFFSGSFLPSDLLWSITFVALFKFCARERLTVPKLLPFILFGVAVWISTCFLSATDHRILYSDDHPSFLYRLALLSEHFPHIPFYNTDWNGGVWAREFFAVGVLNVYFLTAPLRWLGLIGDLRLIENAPNYNLIIPYLFLFVGPLSVYVAARVLKLSRETAFFAGLLAIAPAISIFEWILRYGTLGFSTSAILFPLTFALLFSMFLGAGELRLRLLLGALAVLSLFAFWSLAVVTLVPLALYCLRHLRSVFSPSRRALLIYFLLSCFVVNAPWVVTFVRESRVLEFVGNAQLPGSHDEQLTAAKDSDAAVVSSIPKRELSFAVGFKRLREQLSKFNVLVLLLVFPGLLALRGERRLVWGISLTAVWLLLLAGWGDLIKPQLELRRMAIFAAYLLCIPAAEGFKQLLDLYNSRLAAKAFTRRTFFSLFAYSSLVSAALLSVLSVASVYGNRSPERFALAPKLLPELVAKLNEAQDGRTFFLGFVLHELGATSLIKQDGGHLAPLALWLNHEVYAFDFTHAKWSSVDPIPVQYRKRGRAGIEEFLDLVGARTMVTFRKEWVSYCKSDPRYVEIFRDNQLRVFRRNGALSLFAKGSGELRRLKRGSLELIPATEESVIKYRFYPGVRLLSALPDVKIEPVAAFTEQLGGGKEQEVSFIRIRVPKHVIESKTPVVIGTP